MNNKAHSIKYRVTLTALWGFTILYTISFFAGKQFFPFDKWIGALFKPVYAMMFGG
jgi:hypothetical protein